MQQLKLINTNSGRILRTKEYRGYGQILKISDDGFEKIYTVEPEDPVYGVCIDHLEFDSPYFRFPSIPIDSIDIMTKNLEDAKKFCQEFFERKEELLKF